MPAVTVPDWSSLTRLPAAARATSPERPVASITVAPGGYEGEGFPVRQRLRRLDVRPA